MTQSRAVECRDPGDATLTAFLDGWETEVTDTGGPYHNIAYSGRYFELATDSARRQFLDEVSEARGPLYSQIPVDGRQKYLDAVCSDLAQEPEHFTTRERMPRSMAQAQSLPHVLLLEGLDSCFAADYAAQLAAGADPGMVDLTAELEDIALAPYKDKTMSYGGKKYSTLYNYWAIQTMCPQFKSAVGAN